MGTIVAVHFGLFKGHKEAQDATENPHHSCRHPFGGRHLVPEAASLQVREGDGGRHGLERDLIRPITRVRVHLLLKIYIL